MTLDDSSSAVPTSEQILSALSRTGFVFEYRVAERFQEEDLDVVLNVAYTDPESGKSREIDVTATAYRNIRESGQAPIIICATLVIECKNYADPLVVIGQGKEIFFHNGEPAITFDPLRFDFPNLGEREQFGIRFALGLGELPSLRDNGFIGSQLVRMDRNKGVWRASNDSVHDSIIYPLIKASDSERAAVTDSGLADDDDPWFLPTFSYTLPVLVTAGPVFAVDVVPGREPIVSNVKWVPLVRHFSGGSVLMHVVTYGGIADYLTERIFPIVEQTNERISQKLELFDPEWLIQQYGQPSLPEPELMEWLDQVRSSRGLRLARSSPCTSKR
jgi:hypothetical protein